MATSLEELFERVAALRMEQRVEEERDAQTDDSALPVEVRLQHAIEDAAYSGQLLYQGLRWTRWMIALIGLLIGFGSLMAITAGDGTTPINVLWLIGLTMLFPLFTVTLSALGSLLLLSDKRGPRGGLWMELIRSLVTRGVRTASKALNQQDPRSARRIEGAVGALQGTYKTIEPVMPWLILRTSQSFSLWLSIGFISALLLRLATIDLTFGWYTTIEGISASMPQITSALSAPFHWMHTNLALDAAFIESTRYSRFSGAFVGGPNAATASGNWWPFLFAGALIWGVLPRLLMVAWAKWNEMRAIANVMRTTEPLHDIRQRLNALSGSSSLFESLEGEDTTDPVKALERAAREGRKTHSKRIATDKTPQKMQSAAFLYWEQDVPVPESVQKRFETSLNVQPIYASTWGNDAEHDAQVLQDVQTKQPTVVVVFVEPFANPGSGFRRQISALRQRAGEHTPILISVGWYAPDGTLREQSDRQVDVWRQSIDALADPALQFFEEEKRKDSTTQTPAKPHE